MKIRSLCNKSLLALAVSGLMMSFVASADVDKMKMMDTNNDGRISTAEHSAGATKMFKQMDANGDGRVTAAEMDSATEMKSDKVGKMSSSEKIKAIDSDGDGVMTATEHEQGSKARFTEMDTDTDGYLSAAEMQAGHARMTSDKTAAPTR